MTAVIVKVEDGEIKVTHPDKILWPEIDVTKMDYIRYLTLISPYMISAMRQRLLMFWCYPDGVTEKAYARKSRPSFAPNWLPGIPYNDSTRMVVNDTKTLVWAANYGALEIHVEADTLAHPHKPTYLALDLDPSIPDAFPEVLEVALCLREVLNSIGLRSLVKTSGATGLHIYVPIKPIYTFQMTRKVNQFIAEYVAAKLPHIVTLDRMVERRGTKLYFDYLQLWHGKTMAAAYSTRATPTATVSTPVTWEEVERGFHPGEFTIATVPNRVRRVGDLFQTITDGDKLNPQGLDSILQFLDTHRR